MKSRCSLLHSSFIHKESFVQRNTIIFQVAQWRKRQVEASIVLICRDRQSCALMPQSNGILLLVPGNRFRVIWVWKMYLPKLKTEKRKRKTYIGSCKEKRCPLTAIWQLNLTWQNTTPSSLSWHKSLGLAPKCQKYAVKHFCGHSRAN